MSWLMLAVVGNSWHVLVCREGAGHGKWSHFPPAQPSARGLFAPSALNEVKANQSKNHAEPVACSSSIMCERERIMPNNHQVYYL